MKTETPDALLDQLLKDFIKLSDEHFVKTGGFKYINFFVEKKVGKRYIDVYISKITQKLETLNWEIDTRWVGGGEERICARRFNPIKEPFKFAVLKAKYYGEINK